MRKTTLFNFLTPTPGTPPLQVPDDELEFDWIQVSETPC
ncbi:hypothetical protein J2S62_000244 [Enteractinococcus fodinae]|uniref:Uncharacterized protein n=1 Tax=Enteractinococcus fodinae TaxID=684663 RepID=A0ABU2AXB8_9MICC|nr:hypothetical protein [Enteractinococcus fodinae]